MAWKLWSASACEAGAHGLLAAFAYLVIVGKIRRLHLSELSSASK